MVATEATAATQAITAQSMIALDDPERSPQLGSFEGAGGFVWWYLEIGDGAGNAIVCIWSFGLPFLPGVAGAARDGQGTPASARPSMHVAGYLAGREELYVLHELRPSEVTSSADLWRFGETTIRTTRQGDDLTVAMSIDLPVHNGPRLQGDVRIVCKQARWVEPSLPATADSSDHRWTPLCGAAFGTARLRCGQTRLLVTGRAYHDRNHATRSLEALGIGHWVWGRVALPDQDRVFYALQPSDGGAATALAITIHGDGTLQLEPGALAESLGPRRTRWGMRDARRWRVTTDAGPFLALEATDAIEDGPFYLRRLCKTDDGAHGTLEAITPARIDRAWQRPLVRMRVSASQQRGSIWLPLFQGPRRKRVARLFGLAARSNDDRTEGNPARGQAATREQP